MPRPCMIPRASCHVRRSSAARVRATLCRAPYAQGSRLLEVLRLERTAPSADVEALLRPDRGSTHGAVFDLECALAAHACVSARYQYHLRRLDQTDAAAAQRLGLRTRSAARRVSRHLARTTWRRRRCGSRHALGVLAQQRGGARLCALHRADVGRCRVHLRGAKGCGRRTRGGYGAQPCLRSCEHAPAGIEIPMRQRESALCRSPG